MKIVLFGCVSTAVADDLCCYGGCEIAPTSCNPPGEYCASQAACTTDCGGTWCTGGGPSPPTPVPTPTPVPPTPTPQPTPAGAYCLSANDMMVAYSGGTVQIRDGGYTVHGNGGVASKATFNLLGGYVEFDVDVSSVQTGVNANLYAIAPSGLGGAGFTDNDNQYCDGAINDRPDCIELDWLESNGNCAGASTLHTVMGEGDGAPCNSWGCRTHWPYNGETSFHMRVEYDQSGAQTIFKNGAALTGYTPNPIQQDWDIIKGEMQSKGVLLYGSEWTGWVPEEWCGSSGCLDCSTYSIDNLVVQGSVVQGPTPRSCGYTNSTDIAV